MEWRLLHKRAWRFLWAAAGVALVASCSSPPKQGTPCQPGRQVACACPGGTDGTQTCAADGKSWLACQCGDSGAGASGGSAGTPGTGGSAGLGGGAGLGGNGGIAGSGAGGGTAGSGGAVNDGGGGTAGQGGADASVGGTGGAAGSSSGGSGGTAGDASTDGGGGTGTALAGCGVPGSGNVLLDLGNAAGIDQIDVSGQRVLSHDHLRWVLWDTTTRQPVISGDSSLGQVSLVGGTLAIRPTGSVDLRSAATGALLSSISTSAAVYGLSTDGSYFWAASKASLKAWSTTGQLLLNRSGDYSKARVFATPQELRVALGPVGADKIETVDLAGTSTTSPAFLGTFHSWFLDGEHFLTNVSTTVRVYTKAASAVQLVSLPTVDKLTGQGSYFWTFGGAYPGKLDIYKIGSATPIATYSWGTPSQTLVTLARGTTIGVIPSPTGESFDLVDLSGASPSKTTVSTAPIGYLTALGADLSGDWAFGNGAGVVFDSTNFQAAGGSYALSCGAALSIAGADTGRTVVAVAAGGILQFDSPQSSALHSVIPFDGGRVQLSSDGSVLAAVGNYLVGDGSLKLFDLPSGSSVQSWQNYVDFDLAPNAARIGRVAPSGNLTACDFSGTPYFATTLSNYHWYHESHSMRLSPDGTLVAVSDPFENNLTPWYTAATNFYQGNTLLGATPGYAACWLDNSRVLIATYHWDQWTETTFSGMEIRDQQGALVATSPLPEILECDRVPNGRIYSHVGNTIYDVATGAAVWTGPVDPQLWPQRGAVAGTKVVYAQGHEIMTATY